MTHTTRRGERVVDLFVPIDVLGVEHTEIRFRAVQLDHMLRWDEGGITSAIALMAELAELDEMSIRLITYPDAELVMNEFLAHVPALIREDILQRRVPQSTPLNQRQRAPEGRGSGNASAALDRAERRAAETAPREAWGPRGEPPAGSPGWLPGTPEDGRVTEGRPRDYVPGIDDEPDTGGFDLGGEST